VFTIFGSGLGPGQSPALAFPLAATLGGVSIKVLSGSATLNAIPLYVSPNQINGIMPSTAPLGRASVQVAYNGVSGNPAPIQIVNSSFGIYTANSAGVGPGVLQNFVSQAAQPINAPTVAAKTGQAITLWGTGLGPVSYADNVAPSVGNLPTQTEVFVGGQPATLLYSGRSPCCAGSDQIVFTVPDNAPLGCWVPVLIRTEGKTVSNSVTMAISADGSPCSESTNPFARAILNGGKIGWVDLQRSAVHDDIASSPPIDRVTDIALVDFRQETGGVFAFNPKFSLPPPGACTVYTVVGDLRDPHAFSLTSPTGRFLDAGPAITVRGPNGSRQIALSQPADIIAAQLGKTIPNSGLRDSSFLVAGSFTVSGAGGADVGAITATATNPAGLAWTNRDQNLAVDRTQPLTINWSGAPAAAPVKITGGNYDFASNGDGAFICVAAAGTNSFAVPPYILANLPQTNKASPIVGGYLSVGALSAPAVFSAKGIDAGVASIETFTVRPVTFK
jgi:uncharacterized protein (TIGR03437 family)